MSKTELVFEFIFKEHNLNQLKQIMIKYIQIEINYIKKNFII